MADKNAQATQDFVPIREVRDGVVVLEDGSLRAVLMASSTNFALKSADEQQAILSQFQSFLNTLDFSIQIFIQSRDLDIRPYLALLEERYEEQTSDLMRIQTREYIEFIRSFTESANIMSKNFFVVVPYSGFSLSTNVGFLKGVFGGGKDSEGTKQEAFEEKRAQLEQRVGVVRQGLTRAGVRAVELGTEELIELYYKLFNPGETEKPISINQKLQE